MLTRARFRNVTLIICVWLSGCALQAEAKDFFVTRSTDRFDGQNVEPGDTVTLQAGTRDALTIRDLVGTADSPIVVRNDSNAAEPVTMSRGSAKKGGFVFACNTCKHVIIDGTSKWAGAPADAYCGAPAGRNGCGIKITATAAGDSPTVFMRLGGYTSDITVRGVEVDGGWPKVGNGWAGFKLDDVKLKSDKHPGVWRENVVLEQNYVHDTMREAFYIGPICCGSQGTKRGAATGGIPLRNITIRKNLVNNAGWDGIQLKSAYEGSNQIYGNVVRNTGLDTSPNIPDGEFMGISCSDSQCDVFNNRVVNSGESAYQARVSALAAEHGPLEINIYNNVSVNAGTAGNHRASGVNIIRASSNVARHKIAVYNNTIVSPRRDGIAVRGENLGSDTRISSNIVVGAGERDIVAPTGSTVTDNGTGNIESFDFVDPANEDFRLRSNSPARDKGSTALYADKDVSGVSRSQNGRPDLGAHEYSQDAEPGDNVHAEKQENAPQSAPSKPE
jgi:hypothetical protein